MRKLNEVEEVLGIVRSDKPDDAARVFAIDAVLAPLMRQRSLDAPSLEGSARALADWIGGHKISADEAAEIVVKLLGERARTVKPSDIERAVTARVGNRPLPAKLAGDPVLMLRWPVVIADLEKRLSPEIVRAWFSTLVVDQVADGVARLATHLPQNMIRQWVERDYSAQLRAAVSIAFGEVRSVEILTRRAAA